MAAKVPSVSGVQGYQTMSACHRQGTVTHREAYAFDGPRADVPGRQNARDARLQRARLAVRPRPQAGSEDVGAGQHEAPGIASNCGRQPLRRRFGPDEYEHGRTGQLRGRAGDVISQANGLKVAVPVKDLNVGLFVNHHVGGSPVSYTHLTLPTTERV